MSALLPPNHPERLRLADEVHARPSEALATPSDAVYVAVLVDPTLRAAEHRHLAALCRAFGAAVPPESASHFSESLGAFRLKWERHGEFSGYTFVVPAAADAGGGVGAMPPAVAEWLGALPGETIFAGRASLVRAPRERGDVAELLKARFGDNVVVGSAVGEGAGRVYTDFRIDDDGFARFVVVDDGFTERQAGRMLQRVFEVEAYRMLALLALPLARAQWQRITEIEGAMVDLMAGIAREGGNDESILQVLTQLAKDIESAIVSTQFRFGACAAYHELVTRRIAELRERRLDGVQTIEEFMTRRFSPAVATVANTSRRLHELSTRVAQACTLLATRVGIAREKQNQALLESMNHRARQQLRLQQTVEGLSLAAILYYVVGLVGYFAKGLKAGGLHVEPDVVVGLAIVPLALVLVVALKSAKRRALAVDRAAAGRR